MKRRSWLILVAVAAAVAASALVASAGYGGKAQPSAPAAEKQRRTITVLSLWVGGERAAFQKVLAAFTRRTGIRTQFESTGGGNVFITALRTRIAAGNPPEVAIIPRPGIMADFARQGALKPLSQLGINNALMRRNYSKAWIDLGTVRGRLYGIAGKANSKTTVWYKPNSFRQLRLRTPQTWAQLLAVTRRIKARGRTPWAVGAGGGDSWTLTDWFENIYLRTAGPARYDRLFAGRLPFTDRSVVNALRMMTQIINNNYVDGGVEGALGTSFREGIAKVFGRRPRAELYFEGGFVGDIARKDFNPSLRPGRTIAFFPFPVINRRIGRPLLGAGDLAVAFVNSPEVRQFMRFIASRQAGQVWVSTGAIVSPNKTVPARAYPNALVRAEARQVTTARVFRFDGSDLLPGALSNEWGSTLQAIIRRPSNMNDELEDFQRRAAREFRR